MCALVQLRGQATTIKQGKILSVSAARLAWFIGVQMVRLGVAVVLAWGGTRFLARTTGLSDLILNAVALEVSRTD